MPLRRITKREAQAKFYTGVEGIILCPCKFRPDGPFSMGCRVFGREWLDKAEGYADSPDLWKGTINSTAWSLMYNNWAYYDTSYETGYYAHYYVEE